MSGPLAASAAAFQPPGLPPQRISRLNTRPENPAGQWVRTVYCSVARPQHVCVPRSRARAWPNACAPCQVVYWMSAAQRSESNPALEFAVRKSNEHMLVRLSSGTRARARAKPRLPFARVCTGHALTLYAGSHSSCSSA